MGGIVRYKIEGETTPDALIVVDPVYGTSESFLLKTDGSGKVVGWDGGEAVVDVHSPSESYLVSVTSSNGTTVKMVDDLSMSDIFMMTEYQAPGETQVVEVPARSEPVVLGPSDPIPLGIVSGTIVVRGKA